MTLGVSWPWGDWDMGTPADIFVRTPGGEGLVCMCRTLHLVPAPIIILPAIQTHSTPFGSCYQQVRLQIHLLIPEWASAPGCQPRAECIWAAIDTCLHETPHLSGTKPQNKYLRASHLSRQKKKGAAEAETVRQHQQLNGHKSEQTLGDSEGQTWEPGVLQSLGSQRVGQDLSTERHKNTWAERILQKLQRGGLLSLWISRHWGPQHSAPRANTHAHTHTHAHAHTLSSGGRFHKETREEHSWVHDLP